MNRENFVGLVFSLAMEEGKGPTEYVLKSFVGEGNHQIVFGIAPLSDPTEEKWVFKIQKPDHRFEMTVLHHSFRIAESLYPDHPLLMPAEERIRRLTEEMLHRIDKSRLVFRIHAYRDLLQSTIEVLGSKYFDRFKVNKLPDEFLSENPAIELMVDENLAFQIESLLEEEMIVDKYRPFFDYCLEAISKTVDKAKREDRYNPLSNNPIFNLLGLHLEDFINWDELLKITDEPQFAQRITPSTAADLQYAVSALHFRAANKKHALDSVKEGTQSGKGELNYAKSEFKRAIFAATTSARYLEMLSSSHIARNPHFSGYAKGWHARTLLLDNDTSGAMNLLESALTELTASESRAERHDTLLELAELLEDSDHRRALKYAKEAERIRLDLQH